MSGELGAGFDGYVDGYTNDMPTASCEAIWERYNGAIPSLYYVLDTRSIVGNCGLFWAAFGRGYTCDLALAGVYSAREAIAIEHLRGTDRMKAEKCPTPERLARIREICASSLPGSAMASEGRELLAALDAYVELDKATTNVVIALREGLGGSLANIVVVMDVLHAARKVKEARDASASLGSPMDAEVVLSTCDVHLFPALARFVVTP